MDNKPYITLTSGAQDALLRAEEKNKDISVYLDRILIATQTIIDAAKDIGAARKREASFIEEAQNKFSAIMAEAKRTNSSASNSNNDMVVGAVRVPQEIIELRKLPYYNAVLIALSRPLKDNWKKHLMVITYNDKDEVISFLISKRKLYSLRTTKYFKNEIEEIAKANYFLSDNGKYFKYRPQLLREEMKKMGVSCSLV
ncbi:MAG: hypothetical protein WC185_05010 [Acholeplasmataceae bacterium]